MLHLSATLKSLLFECCLPLTNIKPRSIPVLIRYEPRKHEVDALDFPSRHTVIDEVYGGAEEAVRIVAELNRPSTLQGAKRNRQPVSVFRFRMPTGPRTTLSWSGAIFIYSCSTLLISFKNDKISFLTVYEYEYMNIDPQHNVAVGSLANWLRLNIE